MDKSGKRGKIPQADWPLIMARYEAGETLASIARTYDCSPPAISYVVSRSRSRQSGSEPPLKPPSAAEPQLIKAMPLDGAANGAAEPPSNEPAAAPATAATIAGAEPTALGRAEGERPPLRSPTPTALHVGNGASGAAMTGRRDALPGRELNGFARPMAPERPAVMPNSPPRPPVPAANAGPEANGDQRRTLHLSLGGGAPLQQHGNGRIAAAEARPVAPPPPHRHDGGGDNGNGRALDDVAEANAPAYAGPPQRAEGNGAHRKDGAGSFIDGELRARVQSDITAFLEAFDAAVAADSQQSRSALREATDRMLRAGARTRIELERLEARSPLPPRDGLVGGGGRLEPAWRHR